MRAATDETRLGSERRGVAAAVLGALGLIGFGWLWLMTATPLDPPEWARIAGVWLMPIGIIGAAILRFTALRGRARRWSIAGLILAATATTGAVLLLALWPY